MDSKTGGVRMMIQSNRPRSSPKIDTWQPDLKEWDEINEKGIQSYVTAEYNYVCS